jgi:CheY-like chemotaxis protein
VAVSVINHKKPSVLFVDDDVEVLNVFGRYLETAGLDVATSSDPWDAIKVAVRMLPNVIVLDYAMPGLNGYDIVDALQCRRDTAAIPVIFFSGWLREPVRALPHVRAFVEKPCTPQELLGVVRMFSGRA